MTNSDMILMELEIFLEQNQRYFGGKAIDGKLHNEYCAILNKLKDLQSEYPPEKLNIVKQEFPNGMTVADLKTVVNSWSEVGDSIDEDCEVWIATGGFTNQVKSIWPLNHRVDDNGNVSADILLEI